MIENTHVIYTKKRAAAQKRFVVCTEPGKRSKLDVDLGMLHAIGYWAPAEKEIDVEERIIEEVWIPFTEVSHVESLLYRQRS